MKEPCIFQNEFKIYLIVSNNFITNGTKKSTEKAIFHRLFEIRTGHMAAMHDLLTGIVEQSHFRKEYKNLVGHETNPGTARQGRCDTNSCMTKIQKA